MPSIRNSSNNGRISQAAPSRHERSKLADKNSGTHLKVGDAVTVFSLESLCPFIEGTGVIESLCPNNDLYWVKFTGDPNCRLRFVNPEWQTNPEHSLMLLRRFFLSDGSLPLFEDFFPDHSSETQ